jgi:hypothetical protein
MDVLSLVEVALRVVIRGCTPGAVDPAATADALAIANSDTKAVLAMRAQLTVKLHWSKQCKV